jgi:peptide/nickel transport system permease protein
VAEPKDRAAVSSVAPGAAAAAAETPEKPQAAPGFAKRLLRRPSARVCVGYLGLLIGIAIIAPIALPGIATQDAGNLAAEFQGPSSQHLLGTDSVGRDVLERLLVGTRPTLVAVAEAVIVALVLGVTAGVATGFVRGWLDEASGWLADLAFSMPGLVILLVVLAVFPQNVSAAMVTLGLLMAPSPMRVVRSATLSVREELYIDAAKVAGLSKPYIIARHVLPRIVGVVIVQAALLGSLALLVQTGLAFLGVLDPVPQPSWGGMVADGMNNISTDFWLIIPPGVVISLTILALGVLADAAYDSVTETWAPRRVTLALFQARQRHESPASGQPVPDGSLLSVTGLTVTAESGARRTAIIEGIDLSLTPGEALGLVGESGCGKTTLAMSILRVQPPGTRIEGGHVWFDGRDLTALPEPALRAVRGGEIGLVSQDPTISLDPSFRVGSQLAEAVRAHRAVDRREAREAAAALLEQVRLPDPAALMRRYPHELSGGMAQRVAIARALAGEPKLLIADEPTTALDVTVQAEILDLLHLLREERGMAVLLVTHDWGVVADVCDRAVVMYAGQVIEEGDVGAIFAKPLHPYTRALMATNPYRRGKRGESLRSIPGTVPSPGRWPAGCHFSPRCGYVTDACREAPIPLSTIENGRQSRCIRAGDLTADATPIAVAGNAPAGETHD